jgi:hypothetical protein
MTPDTVDHHNNNKINNDVFLTKSFIVHPTTVRSNQSVFFFGHHLLVQRLCDRRRHKNFQRMEGENLLALQSSMPVLRPSSTTPTAKSWSRMFWGLLTPALLWACRNRNHDSMGITMVGAFSPSNSVCRPISRNILLWRAGTTSLPLPIHSSSSSTTTFLQSNGDDWFDGFKKFFGGMGDGENDNVAPKTFTSSSSSSASSKYSNENQSDKVDFEDEEEDELPAGTTLLLSIPAKRLKLGGLRLFLMFYLMGMQNTPHANAWKAHQPTIRGSEDGDDDKHVLEMYFHDATGMIQIEMISCDDIGDDGQEETNKSQVRVLRCGSVPSTAYLMQESVIVDGILDELQQCAFDGSIAPTDRLVIPEPITAIEDARRALSFG